VKRPYTFPADVEEGSKFVKYLPHFAEFDVEDLCEIRGRDGVEIFNVFKTNCCGLDGHVDVIARFEDEGI